jgi:hypothetical protein
LAEIQVVRVAREQEQTKARELLFPAETRVLPQVIPMLELTVRVEVAEEIRETVFPLTFQVEKEYHYQNRFTRETMKVLW